ncbi:MAG: TerB family tellurite resistance protein [Bacteroidota bacterium]
MSFKDLFKSGAHARNLGHFGSIVNIATVDGVITESEEGLMKRLARKLNISEHDYEAILKDPSKYPLQPENSAQDRLERMHDLFEMIYADHDIDDDERKLIEKYAIALGYTDALAEKLIKRSIQIYQGGLDLEDYRYLLNKK